MAPGTIGDRVMSALCILFDLKTLWLSDLEGIRSWSEGLHLALCNLAGNRVRPNLRLDGDTLKGDHWASVLQTQPRSPHPKNGIKSGSTNARGDATKSQMGAKYGPKKKDPSKKDLVMVPSTMHVSEE